MDVDFDKEIDTLLRKAHRDAPVLVGDYASSGHLDADEISAFAENAMPEKSRALYSAHLADCDRCRKMLSNLLVMNAESAPAAAPSLSAITIAERAAEPWYRRLFLFPNLAYVMGGLVLLFAGFLGYTVMRNASSGDAFVSQVSEKAETRGGPNFQAEPELPIALANSNAASNMAANTATATDALVGRDANSSPEARAITEATPVAGPRTNENNFVLDGVEANSPPAPPPVAAAEAAPKDKERDRDDAKLKVEEKATGTTLDLAKNDNISKQQQYSLPAQSGPMRNNENLYNRQLENLQRRPAAKRAEQAEDESPSGRRAVGGKTFERKQSVWYDVTYQGRPTINVRRGTDEYNRLDGGLRAIANSLSGTVVVVWGAKAYRIQ